MNKDILLQSKKEVTKGHQKETIKTTGCIGGCPSFTKDRLPDCKKCSQFTGVSDDR